MNDKRAMNQGFGDGMSRAFELVGTPLVFAGFGLLLDRVVGTSPMFTIAFAVFGVVGTFVRMWYGYDSEMRSHEASGAWVRPEDRLKTPLQDENDIWDASRRRTADRDA
jgi:F0F1-type ATP synthase assembly protein I